jgi:hypothetical protein
MLRFPNPGSDIDSFVRIYQELFEALNDRAAFGLDDFSATLVERNLATSCGFMGQEALLRSTRDDRSRDPLYNQSKMYSELYKVLGWLHPSSDSALRFRFTYLGAHIAAARRDPRALVRESVLGIVYPNAILNVKGSLALRPFATILRSMGALDGLLCRDEMIIGPLCLENDRDRKKVYAMVKTIAGLRGVWSRLSAKLEEISDERKIDINTMANYTRFPIAIMKWSGWADSQRRKDIYGHPMTFLVLTEEGHEALARIESYQDIRAADLESWDDKIKTAFVRIGFYQMLDRAGFDISQVARQLSDDLRIVSSVTTHSEFLFSPFQELSMDSLSTIFPSVSGASQSQTTTIIGASESKTHLKSSVALAKSRAEQKCDDPELVGLFQSVSTKAKGDIRRIADMIAVSLSASNKDEFYPFVVRLFRLLGYACELSRVGVNYQRWDAIIIDQQHSVPIEIKSPGEEEYLSVKAVRQALENKIVLLSRKSYPTTPSTTSLVVGYNLPNDRSEVSSLISDIRATFGVAIGVIDLRSLLIMGGAKILQGKNHDSEALRCLDGIIAISDI